MLFKPYKLKWINIGNKKIKDGIEIFNDNLKNILNYKNILSQEEYDTLNINNLYNYNFINVNDSYYKAYDNYNIGLNWILNSLGDLLIVWIGLFLLKIWFKNSNSHLRKWNWTAFIILFSIMLIPQMLLLNLLYCCDLYRQFHYQL